MKMKYYPVVKNWRKIKSVINDKDIQEVMVRDFDKFTYGRWEKPFKHGELPGEWETCDWQFERKGRPPEFWMYVKHSACHWLVNFNLMLAMKVEPKRKWRILTSQKHSTVWDGENTLFDFNFLALQVDPDEAFEMANRKQLKEGVKKRIFLAEKVILK